MVSTAFDEKPYAGNPHVRFDDRDVTSAKPKRSSLRYKKQLVFVVAVSAALVGSAGTLGFWDFKDGMPGDDVTTVSNSSGMKSYTSATAQKTGGSTGVLPKFNSDSPGKLKDGVNGDVISADPQSIDFRYVSRSSLYGGYIDLDGVADDISGKGSFTIEYFVKQNADYSYYETGDGDWEQRSKTMLYLENRTGYGALKQIMPVEVEKTTKHGKGASLQVYAHAPIAGKTVANSVDLCDGKWHHVAIVYTETNATVKTGKAAFYWDHAKVNEADYLNDPNGTTGLKLRIGTGYKDHSGVDKTTTEPVNASISALRVSDTALVIDEFLCGSNPDYELDADGTVALLTFAGKTAGVSAASVAYDATDLPILGNGEGIALNGLDTGCVPAYNDDIPGKYLYSSRLRETVLATDYKSLKFTSMGEGVSVAEPSNGVGGGCVNFPLLGTALSYQKSYTIEMFIKNEDWSEWQWESGLFTFFSKTNSIAYKNQCNVSSVKAGKTSWYVNMQDRSTVSKPATWKDGKWHHVALVYDGDTKKQTIYLDYVAGTSVDYTNGFASGERFVLGCRDNSPNYSWHGKITGVRIMPRALTANDFMVAADYRLPAGYVFSVSFNDGEGKNGQTFVSGNTQTSNKVLLQTGEAFMRCNYGLHAAAYPQFAAGSGMLIGRKALWGSEKVWENLAGCRFLGYASLTNGTPNRAYAGTELNVPGSQDKWRNPDSWTMEAFVKPEYDSQDKCLLFGKSAVNNQHDTLKPFPEFCWMLTRDMNGKLKLFWTEQAADPDYQYTSSSTDYYKNAVTDTEVLKDHSWHHVALSYDKPTKTFKLYVNYQLVLTQATSGLELFDSVHGYYFSRIAASNGFEGWMDEIRFSNKALLPNEMVQLVGSPGFILYLR